MSYEEFRKRIDTARQILVGAVPSPAGQIDQITYALMYKFMNDRDDEAASMGGVRSFFIGEYAKYNWHELMKLGGHEQLALYRQALESMGKNENIPELFRSIYQNAFLPFNSPNVLHMFLKEIDKFNHGESDDIGDAYEYLLSITGAQGDVGQFRTPRHIIKFIIEAVNPTKNDKVLDPAVGTAGFLIAAYNHVKAQHDGKDGEGNVNDEDRLTADEKKKIFHNYRGFDIDPTMVRTAKVNMYLHGFPTPDIINHDSLSSEEYWDDWYDVILANPPFMSPKGGIQPHRKFGITANRAEVLFVDYIASHLKPNGRAGIIVPEGIIFQSGNAYKELRKNLVKNYLYAVVSLPAGVFNPYAGVKTSVLLLDKDIAKERDEILFVKIENDGYSLGAQRRPVVGDQLPEALELIKNFKSGEEVNTSLAQSVERDRISESGDYNLSSDRYRTVSLENVSDFEFRKIEEIVETISAKVKIKSSDVLCEGLIPVIDQSQKFIAGYTDNKEAEIADIPVVAFGDHTRAVKYIDFSFAQGADGIKILKAKDRVNLNEKYLSYLMSNMEMPDKGYSRHWSDVRLMQIPQPPIEIQREIVAELDCYQKIIDAAQTIVKTYKPTIKINPEWQILSLGDICEFTQGVQIPKSDLATEKKDGYDRYLYIQDFKGENKSLYVKDIYPKKKLTAHDIVMANTGTPGRAFLAKPGILSNNLFKISFDDKKVNQKFLYTYLESEPFQAILQSKMKGGIQKHLGHVTIAEQKVSLPPIEIQREIVAELEAEQQLVDANKKLIEIYQQKIKSKIAEVWGE